MTEDYFKKVAILGPGLIGASLGLFMKCTGLAGEIVGLARREETLKKAKEIGAIDQGTTDLKEAVWNSDLVIFAVPVLATIALFKGIGKIGPWASLSEGKRPLLIDTCSTKQEVVQAAQKYLPSEVDFIAGHPMAGGEMSGPEFAREDLFEGALWILTPDKEISPDAQQRVESLIHKAGARSLILSADVHDEMTAAVSHLPHMLSVALMEETAELGKTYPEVWQVAAAGFQTMTRLAAGSVEMWKDICLTNAEPLAEKMAEFRSKLEEIENYLRRRDGRALEEIFRRAQLERKIR